MKKLITPVLFLFFASVIVAQTTADDYYSGSKPKLSAKDRVSTSISMGAGFSFLNSTHSTAYTTFVASKIGYQLTPKFKLNLGLMHYTATGNLFMPLNQNEAIVNTSNRTVSGNLFFVEGQYQLNKQLIMSGAVMVDANGLNNSKLNNYKAASLGLEYKVTEHSSIGLKASLSQGNSNGDYLFNPRTNQFDYRPHETPMQDIMFGFGQWGVDQLNSVAK